MANDSCRFFFLRIVRPSLLDAPLRACTVLVILNTNSERWNEFNGFENSNLTIYDKALVRATALRYRAQHLIKGAGVTEEKHSRDQEGKENER